MKKQRHPGLRLFCLSACVIALLLGGCAAVLAAMGAISDRVVYHGFLIYYCIAVLGGAALVSRALMAVRKKSQRETRRWEARLEELEKEQAVLRAETERREEFIASFAHELKTPLTAIIGYADMLRSKDMGPKPRFTAAGYIFSEGKRLEALSLKLLDIIVLGKQELQKRRYDSGSLLREVAAVAAPSTGGDGLELHLRCEKGEIWIEPDLFKTLLINLVDNARKASKKGQSVELSGRNEEGGFAFYVRDHGRGMRQEELTKIMEPFYMIDKSRSRAQNGAGLGLALCQKIAELHGTKLEYSSTLGEGTTVRVFLQGGEWL